MARTCRCKTGKGKFAKCRKGMKKVCYNVRRGRKGKRR